MLEKEVHPSSKESCSEKDLASLEIGKLISKLRNEADLTQKDLANALAVTVTTIANWENGRRSLTWLSQAQKLCEALKCELADLIPNDTKPTYDELLELYESGKLGKLDGK